MDHCRNHSRRPARYAAAAIVMTLLSSAFVHPPVATVHAVGGQHPAGFLGAWTLHTPAASPPPRSDAATAFDAADGTVVLFGGQGATGPLGDTWTWDGTTWTQHSAGERPPARAGAAMVFDAATGTAVLFGGEGPSAPLADTWTWNGSTWTLRAPATSPPARSVATMAFDPVTGAAVLFGGLGPSGPLADTWTWDGTTWTQHSAGASPPARSASPGAFDEASGTVVLFGGLGASGPLGDTWTWDGGTWTEKTPTSSPPARSDAAIAFGRGLGSLVLFGGQAANGVLGDTWVWAGTTWTPQYLATSPQARSGGALADDDATGALTLVGGTSSSHDVLADTWTYALAATRLKWTPGTPTVSPPASAGMSSAFDPAIGRVAVIGGSSADNSLWLWDGSTWTPESLGFPGSAVVIDGGSMAFDAATGSLLLFALPRSGAPADSTWTWNGQDAWVAANPAASPTARTFSSMAFDSATGKLILFGGSDAGGNPLGDTWSWDGSNWIQLTPAASPPAREGAAMTFDPATGDLVLFGGVGDSGFMGDTWTWDGATWTQRTSQTSPSPSAFSGFDYDAAAHGAVLVGGYPGPQSDVWLWAGSAWKQLASNGPPGRYLPAADFDPATGQFVVFGGATLSSQLGDTWIYAAAGVSTATGLSTSANPIVVGQTVAFNAAVAAGAGAVPSGGMVQFEVDGAPEGTPVPIDAGGRATMTTSFPTATPSGAPHQISAVYLGSNPYDASSATLASGESVLMDGTTTTVQSTGATTAGQSLDLVAAVAPTPPGGGVPTGTITFSDGPTPLGAQAVDSSGRATITVPGATAGVHTITAAYGGDGGFAPSNGALAITVASDAGAAFTGGPGSSGGRGPLGTVLALAGGLRSLFGPTAFGRAGLSVGPAPISRASAGAAGSRASGSPTRGRPRAGALVAKPAFVLPWWALGLACAIAAFALAVAAIVARWRLRQPPETSSAIVSPPGVRPR